MTDSGEPRKGKRTHRTLAQQLNRSPGVVHASWLTGLAVLLAGGASVGTLNAAGLLFLIVVFLPIIIAYRRDRLTYPTLFATFFLPTWPWAMYKACSRQPRPIPGDVAG